MKRVPLLFSVSLFACSGGAGDDGDAGDMSMQYFRATIDGVAFEADSDRIAVVLSDLGSGPQIQVTGTRAETRDYFTILLPVFSGSEVTRMCADAGTLIRYTGSEIVECSSIPFGSGTLTISKVAGASADTYQGTFSGTFENPISHGTRTITGGEFLAERLL